MFSLRSTIFVKRGAVVFWQVRLKVRCARKVAGWVSSPERMMLSP